MSQLVAVSAPASGQEILDRYRAASGRLRGLQRVLAPPARLRAVQAALAAPCEPEPRAVEYAISIPDPLVAEASALAAAARIIFMAEILKAVAAHFNVRRGDLIADNRSRVLCRPRHVVMYLCREMTPRSFSDIAKLLGGKDPTSIIHGWRKVRDQIAAGDPIAADVEAIRARLQA